MEDEERAHRDKGKAHGLIPAERLLEIDSRKSREDDQRNDFLIGLELRRRLHRAAPAIRRHRQPVFE